jgi:hypothetical protein
MRRMASQKLIDLRERVDTWRRKQGKRTRIPQELWDAAVQVAGTDGLWATARATRFNYEKLRQMVASARRQRRSVHNALAVIDQPRLRCGVPARVEPAFVELPVGAMGGLNRTVIDMLGRQGDRMRVDTGGGVDVVGLVKAFWSRQP